MKLLVCLTIFVLLTTTAARACDVCGCYMPNQELQSEPLRPRLGGFYLASAEQYTFFGTTKFSGHEVDNVADQYEQSSITQVIAGYNFNDRLGVQVNAPFIEREYKRPEGFRTDRGSVSGLGDMSLLGNYVAYRTSAREKFSFSLNVIAGVKFPTGSAGRIKEEFNEVEVPGAPDSGIHGHDLARGSGSYDAVLGAGIFTRYGAGFLQANAQYTVRTTGAYDYRYANELSFDVGPGWFFLEGKRLGALGPVTLGAQCVVSGEHKNRDTFRGETEGDTGVTALYVGPRLLAGVGKRYIGEIGADLPVLIDNTSFQVVPSYRIRAGLSVKF